jgi:hypothetical protein
VQEEIIILPSDSSEEIQNQLMSTWYKVILLCFLGSPFFWISVGSSKLF